MTFDFDREIPRRGTASSKWDTLTEHFGHEDVLPLWVADMDFAAPPAVIEALVERARHGIFGYVALPDAFYEAIVGWLWRRHGWRIEREWIVVAPGVVPSLRALIETWTEPGERVVIQPPVYHPFPRLIAGAGRTVVENPLVVRDGRYEMDLDGLDRALSGARMLLLCSPHNPVGRVWTPAELGEVARLCAAHGTLVISDEVHCDLVYPGFRHTPFPAAPGAGDLPTAVCVSPSKTFNLAGFRTSVAVIADPGRRRLCQGHALLHGANTFGAVGLQAAYARGGPWLDELLGYLAGNLALLREFLAERTPEVRLVEPEGTYLAWLDCRALGLDDEALDRFIRREARLGLNAGHTFGRGGSGFQRINLACTRALLREALERLQAAVERHRAEAGA